MIGAADAAEETKVKTPIAPAKVLPSNLTFEICLWFSMSFAPVFSNDVLSGPGLPMLFAKRPNPCHADR
jgi:hypothetical protein